MIVNSRTLIQPEKFGSKERQSGRPSCWDSNFVKRYLLERTMYILSLIFSESLFFFTFDTFWKKRSSNAIQNLKIRTRYFSVSTTRNDFCFCLKWSHFVPNTQKKRKKKKEVVATRATVRKSRLVKHTGGSHTVIVRAGRWVGGRVGTR